MAMRHRALGRPKQKPKRLTAQEQRIKQWESETTAWLPVVTALTIGMGIAARVYTKMQTTPPYSSAPLRNGTIPTIGLGTWNLRGPACARAVEQALAVGYRHIDTAASYGNEAAIGSVLGRLESVELVGGGKLRRQDLFVTSKLPNDAHAEADVERAAMRSARDLKVRYLDLYLMHWPVATTKASRGGPPVVDSALSTDEALLKTWAAMEALVRLGLVKAIGVSNFSEKRLRWLLERAEIAPAVLQVELHPYLPQTSLVRYAQKRGVHVTAYSPLGSPGRPERHRSDADPPPLIGHRAVMHAGSKSGCTMAQVLLRWAVQRGCSAVPKASPGRHVRENFGRCEMLKADAVALLAEADLKEGGRHIRGAALLEGLGVSHEEFWGAERPSADATAAALTQFSEALQSTKRGKRKKKNLASPSPSKKQSQQ